MIRTLVGYNHVPGPAAMARPRPRNLGAQTDRRRPHLHLPPQARSALWPAGSRERSRPATSCMRSSGSPGRRTGPNTPSTTRRSRDSTPTGTAKRSPSRGSGRPMQARSCSTSRSRQATSSTGSRSRATGPIPVEIAKCFEGQAGRYGRDVVSSGPYMIEGADEVAGSSCAALKPMRGFDGLTSSPSSGTPTTTRRRTHPRRGELPGPVRIHRRRERRRHRRPRHGRRARGRERRRASRLRRSGSTRTNPVKRARLHLDSADRTPVPGHELTQPPFDDVHVRRPAMNWSPPRQSRRYATTRRPPTAARAARRPAITLLLLTSTRDACIPPDPPHRRGRREEDRDHVRLQGDGGASAVLGTTAKNIPIAIFTAWAKDYPDAVTFLSPLFDGRTIIPVGNTDVSMVGLDPSQAPKLGLTGSTTSVPNVNAELDRCAARAGRAGVPATSGSTRKLMTKAVPWVPYLQANVAHITGPQVTQWQFDQFSGGTAYADVAVSLSGAGSPCETRNPENRWSGLG